MSKSANLSFPILVCILPGKKLKTLEYLRSQNKMMKLMMEITSKKIKGVPGVKVVNVYATV